MNKKYIYFSILLLIFSFIFYQYKKVDFSVIIPVYNSEKYILKCLDSIISQDGKFDIIIVNDGSTDGTLNKIKEYSKKHSNIHIVNQKNQGVSSARNRGILEAKTKYITFVDSDDWLEPNAFADVLSIIKKDNPDIVITGFNDVFDKEWVRNVYGAEEALTVNDFNKFPNRNLDKLSILSPFNANEAHSDLYYIGGGVRARFFNKEFIEKNNISFFSNVSCYEDDIFLYQLFQHNPKISILSRPIYNYLNRFDSISKSKTMMQCGKYSWGVMQQTKEYQSAKKRHQMLISDSFLGYIFVGTANLIRHKIPLDSVMPDIENSFQYFDKYNYQEKEACRNYQKLKLYLKEISN